MSYLGHRRLVNRRCPGHWPISGNGWVTCHREPRNRTIGHPRFTGRWCPNLNLVKISLSLSRALRIHCFTTFSIIQWYPDIEFSKLNHWTILDFIKVKNLRYFVTDLDMRRPMWGELFSERLLKLDFTSYLLDNVYSRSFLSWQVRNLSETKAHLQTALALLLCSRYEFYGFSFHAWLVVSYEWQRQTTCYCNFSLMMGISYRYAPVLIVKITMVGVFQESAHIL